VTDRPARFDGKVALVIGGDRSDPSRIRQIPMGRIGNAAEVAVAVLFLASDEAGWVTGQTVDATGGYGL